MLNWTTPIELRKNCDPELLKMAEQFNTHIADMELMTPQVLVYDRKENPIKLFNRIKAKIDFFNEFRPVLESYKNEHYGKLNIYEEGLVEYMQGFYSDYHEELKRQSAECMDDLTKALRRFNGDVKQ